MKNNDMKHRLILLLAVLLMASFLYGCGSGESSVDVGKHGIVKLPNGDIVEGEVQSITRWSEATLEITIDGYTYTVHPLNVAIIEKGAGE